jgi:hypothetical protein
VAGKQAIAGALDMQEDLGRGIAPPGGSSGLPGGWSRSLRGGWPRDVRHSLLDAIRRLVEALEIERRLARLLPRLS